MEVSKKYVFKYFWGHCLKIIQNVAFEFIYLGLFRLVLLQLTGLVTLFDRKLQVFKNSPKLTIFGILNDCKLSSLRSQC